MRNKARSNKVEKLRINHWRDTESTRDAARLTIQDYLWNENTGLPETYFEGDVRDKTEVVFVHVFRAYPTVPSPYYAGAASWRVAKEDMSFNPNFTITNRMTRATTRTERARSAWHRFELGHFCDNFATRFTTASCDRAMAGTVTTRTVSRQIATRIAPFQAAREAT